MPLASENLHDPRMAHQRTAAGPARLVTWPGVLAGFHADFDGVDEEVDAGAADGSGQASDGSSGGSAVAGPGGLLHAGESWAGSSFFIAAHRHPVWELYLQAHGTTRWVVDGERLVLRPGSVLAVAPHLEHALAEPPLARHHFFYAALDVERAAAGLRPGAELTAAWQPGRAVHVRSGEALAAPFRQLVREVALRQPLRTEGLRAAAALLVVEAARLMLGAEAGADPAAVAGLPQRPEVGRARRLLDERYGEPWRLVDLAAGSGLSPGHLAELFTREVGLPPQRYLTERRLERAAELLATSDLPITAVALEVGFGSGPHFSRVFRASMRCSPREYRRRHRETPTS